MTRRRGAPDWARRARGHWAHRGRSRPPFAEAPGAGEESVWDYPRPPRLVPDAREVVVETLSDAAPLEVARTRRSRRVLETASPPTFYLPPDDVRTDWLVAAEGTTRCEWKGEARYFDLVGPGERLARVAWCYEAPFEPFGEIAGWLSFYPARLRCRVAGELVRPQAGGFYGGWVTREIRGPMKGDPGTEGW